MMQTRATTGWFILDWRWQGEPRVESVLGLDHTAAAIVFALPNEPAFAGYAFRTECDEARCDEPGYRCPIRRWKMDDDAAADAGGKVGRQRARVSMVKSHC